MTRLASCHSWTEQHQVCILTMDIDDSEGPESEPRPTAQLPAHQLDNLCDLVIALLQKVLAGSQEETFSQSGFSSSASHLEGWHPEVQARPGYPPSNHSFPHPIH